MLFDVEVPWPRSKLSGSGPLLGWGAGSRMGDLSTNRRSGLAVCERPIAPVDPGYLGGRDSLPLVAEPFLQPLAMKFHKGAAAQDDSVANVANLAP
jgi:hypothetical protein